MAEILNCDFCNNSNDEVKLFSEETLKSCRRDLSFGKEHNLEYKDVVLPGKESEGGYHKDCQELFTASMKRSFGFKSNTNVESVEKKKSNDTDDLCSETSSVPKLSTPLIEPQCSSTVTILTPKPIKLLIPVIRLERIKLEPAEPSTVEENSKQLENINLSSENNLKSNYKRNICIFCDRYLKRYRQYKQRLYSTEKDAFLLKIKQGRENCQEFYDKIANHPGSKVYYHNVCKRRFCFKTPSISNKAAGVRSWHHISQNHQKAFVKVCSFIRKNVVKKERCYFMNYICKIYMDYLKKRSKKSAKKFSCYLSTQHLGDKIITALHADVKFFLVRNKMILASKNLKAIDDKLFEKLKDDNRLLERQFQFYQGNYQEKNSVDDEAENFEDVDDKDKLSVV